MLLLATSHKCYQSAVKNNVNSNLDQVNFKPNSLEPNTKTNRYLRSFKLKSDRVKHKFYRWNTQRGLKELP